MNDVPNRVIVAEFRQLLTEGFYAIASDTGEILEGDEKQSALAATKPWRGELWKAFREIEDRLCPQPSPKGGSNEKTD